MRISIDTKEDSPEAIRKAINLLSHLVGHVSEKHTDIFSSDSDPAQETESNLMGMFNNEGVEPAQEEPQTEEKNEKASVEIIDLD